MLPRMPTPALLNPLALLAAGCTLSPVASERVETEDLFLAVDVETTEDGSHLEASLRLDEGFVTSTPVFLGVGDRLWATVDGEEYELDPSPAASQGAPVYVADIPVSRGGAWVQVSLEREHGLEARYSGIALPADFSLLEPVEGAMRSRNDDALTIRYGGSSAVFDPTSADMSLEVHGDCFGVLSHEGRPDMGWFELAPGSLVGSGTCEGEVVLERRGAEGALDPALGGGSVEARQIRSSRFWSTD